MTEPTVQTTEPAATTPDKSLMARAVGVLISPRETFAAVAARPRWFGMMAIVIVLTAGSAGWLLTTTAGRNAAWDKTEKSFETMKGFGLNIPEEARDQARRDILEAPAWKIALRPVLGIAIFTPIIWLIYAGLLLLVFNVFMGGTAKFKQVFSIVAHASAVSVLQVVITTPLNYFQESFDSKTTLAVLVPMLDDTSFVARLLGSVDFFICWWVFVLAVGLAVLYKRRTTPIAVSLFAVYGVIALAIASIAAMFAARS